MIFFIIIWSISLQMLAIWGFSFSYTPFAVPSAYQEIMVFAGGGLFFIGASLFGSGRLKIPYISILFLLLGLLVALQSRTLSYSYALQPLQGVLYFLWAALLSWAAWQWREKLGAERFYRHVAMALLAGSLLAALTGLLAVIAGGSGTSGGLSAYGFYESGVLSGPLRQRNLYATLLLSGIVCLAWLSGNGRWRWWAVIAGGLLLALPLGITGSRTGLLVCGLLAVFSAGMLLLPAGRRQSVFCVNLLVLAVLALAGQFVVPLLVEALGWEGVSALARAMESSDGAQSTLLRLQAWERAWHIFLEHPLLGVGFNNLAIADFSLRAGAFAQHLQPSTFFTHCHNLFLQIFAELGLVGGLLLLALCWQILLGLKRHWREPFGLFGIVVLVPMAVHSLLEFPLWYAFFLGPWLLLAQGGSAWTLDAHYLRSFRFVTVMLSVGLIFLGWSLISGIRDMDKVAGSLIKGDKTGAYQQAWMLTQSNGLVAPYAERAITMLVLPGENAAENRQALQLVDRVMRWKPYPLAPYKLAIWLMVTGEEAKAYAMLKDAITVYPDEAKGFTVFLDQMAAPGLAEKREKLRARFEALQAARHRS